MATRVNPLLNNFSRGELSPKMQGRVNTEIYQTGCRTLENMLVMPEGGVEKMPGSYYVSEVKDSTKDVRLISFVVSQTEAYVLEFGDQYIRFYKDHAQVESGGSPYEVATTYLEADLFELKYIQINKVMYIVHPGYTPRKLTYTSETSWAIADVSFTIGGGDDDFTVLDNYPRSIAFLEDRLIFGGSNNFPQKIWGSKTGVYENFTTGTGDGDAWAFEINSREKLEIFWMEAQTDLIIGTLGGEIKLSGLGQGITPSNVVASKQSNYGSADIQGKVVNDVIIFVQRSKKKVRSYFFYDKQSSYASPELTLYSDHILGDGGCIDFVTQQSPETIIWFVRSDGKIAGLTYDRTSGLNGWHIHDTQGEYKSLAVIPTSAQDEIWACVERTINGATVKYIEYFEQRDITGIREQHFLHTGAYLDNGASVNISNITSDTECTVTTSTNHGLFTGHYVRLADISGMIELNGKSFYVEAIDLTNFKIKTLNGLSYIDSSVYTTYSSGGTAEKVINQITGLNHLEAASVSILGDGAVFPNATVTAGIITLNRYCNTIRVGLGYDAVLETQKIEGGTQFGTAIGQKKKVSKVRVEVYNSSVFKVGKDLDNLENIVYRRTQDLLDYPTDLITDNVENVFNDNTDKLDSIFIVQDDPLPLILLAVIPEIMIIER